MGRRAVLNGKLDLVQAEAVGDLIDARSSGMRRGSTRSCCCSPLRPPQTRRSSSSATRASSSSRPRSCRPGVVRPAWEESLLGFPQAGPHLLLPCLRADIAALESFVLPTRPPLDIPIAAFGGDSDGQTPVKDLDPWRLETTAGFGVRVFPGGHFYLDALREKVLAEVQTILRPYITLAGGSPRP